MPPRSNGPSTPVRSMSPLGAAARPPAISPTTAATPTAARYVEPSPNAAAASPTGLPPLKTMLQLVERFSVIHVGMDRLLPPPDQIGHFNAESFRNLAVSHLEGYELKKSREQQQGVTQTVVELRPAVDKVSYFADLSEGALAEAKRTGALKLFSVPTMALATTMANRGYIKVHCNHLSGELHLPGSVAASAGGAGASRRRKSYAPPGIVIPPTGLGSTDRCGEETVAEQIVREFELHVKVGSTYYSPAYKWDKHARQAAGRHPCHSL